MAVTSSSVRLQTPFVTGFVSVFEPGEGCRQGDQPGVVVIRFGELSKEGGKMLSLN